jgi:Protein of unknown function (DUF3180)
MRRTTPGDLAVPFVIIAVTVYVLLRRSYGAIPPLQFLTAVPLAALALVEIVVARRVAAAIAHRPGARLMSALTIARCAALGKATSLAAAGVLGAAAGLLARVAPDARRVTAAGHDTAVGIAIAGAAIALAVAGWLLERAALDPNANRQDGPQ